ncbi:probable transmembrane reductase CYB561D1 isoform X3 [Eleutherodactylus coqui]|uniref:probable transmembrane reductase CYB561D1 isoform X3 n=1 Tax=Eleutherodactylus coqui TaxID=57060 RepID=UPI003462DF33
MPETSALYTLPGAESPRVPDYWLYKCLRRFSGFVAHFLALGFTIFLVILARPGTSLFSWHPVFMAAAKPPHSARFPTSPRPACTGLYNSVYQFLLE